MVVGISLKQLDVLPGKLRWVNYLPQTLRQNYFIDLYPKIRVGGCYTAHNVSDRRWGRRGGGTAEFYDYVKSLPNMETTVDNSGAGMSISYKKSAE